jgi:transcriptional regulator with XRE-family HTH domain
MSEFAKAFREERLRTKTTLREIAEHTDKSIGYLSDIEHSRKGVPDLETVRLMEECMLITDGRLIKLAARERMTLPPKVMENIQRRPALADMLMRADEFTDEQIQNFLKSNQQEN